MVNILHVECGLSCTKFSLWFERDFGCLKYVVFSWNTFHNYSRLTHWKKTKSERKKRNKRLREGTIEYEPKRWLDMYREMLYIYMCIWHASASLLWLISIQKLWLLTLLDAGWMNEMIFGERRCRFLFLCFSRSVFDYQCVVSVSSKCLGVIYCPVYTRQ